MLNLVLIILVLFIISILMLCVRLRVNLSGEQKKIFAGLGRSGVEYDFTLKKGFICLLGKNIKSIKSEAEKKKKAKQIKKPSKPKAKKPSRKRSLSGFLKIIPKSSKAFGNYLLFLLKSIIVEELSGTIKAGFDSPCLTGQIYGYYQAALGAVPSMAGRVIYIPVWDEELFEVSFKASVAIPLYKIVYRTMILIIKLPLREIIKLAIGKKERRP